MTIVFFTHPEFFPSLSMTKFAQLLAKGMAAKGHTITQWAPEARFVRLPAPKQHKKWLGYIDQYLIFPAQIRSRIKTLPRDTLFVFTDNALAPWLPAVASRPHVMHCHDFLALRSALGEEPENPTSVTGQQYQKYIRRGYLPGKHFISDSCKTKADLQRFLDTEPVTSDMVYVGLNPLFQPQDPAQARQALSTLTGVDVSQGHLLHVGGNQWYKNRRGVLELYQELCRDHSCQLPLLMIGHPPGSELLHQWQVSPYRDNIHFLSGLHDEDIAGAYAGATLFLFPSLAEGFGWPIAEAMASGCPVVTTNEAPMTEVAGEAAILINRRPSEKNQVTRWATESAEVIQQALNLSATDRVCLIKKGLKNVERFAIDSYIDEIERVYQSVLDQYV